MTLAPAGEVRPHGAGLRSHWGLEEGVRFLNHGAFGATPKEVLAEQQRWRARMESDPPRFFTRELPELVRSAATSLADFVGTAPERLAFVENATSGVNAVLRSLSFAPGDEILTTDHAYPGVRNTLRYVAERNEARLIEARISLPIVDAGVIAEAIAARLTPRTRLVVIDHVASASALRFPVAAITRLCRANGIAVLVDGAHAPGMVELDVDAISADWYVGNCHKWLCAPKGAAFIVLGKEARAAIHPTVISNAHGLGFPVEFDYVGTRDPTAWLAVPAAIDFHRRLGGAEVRSRNRALARQVAARLPGEVAGVLAASLDLFEAMIAIHLPIARPVTRDEARGIQGRLSLEHGIEAAMTTLGSVLYLRLSCFAYNEIEDYLSLGDVLPHLIEQTLQPRPERN